MVTKLKIWSRGPMVLQTGPICIRPICSAAPFHICRFGTHHVYHREGPEDLIFRARLASGVVGSNSRMETARRRSSITGRISSRRRICGQEEETERRRRLWAIPYQIIKGWTPKVVRF
ncbi:hypothetical protein AVEN_169763-1 [Araneus ventricosus]|uniref:Uncharacterized protein n=1 Tax=Araneus ventricosus TaxID=182803 RepID=A0A4Y2HL42_ARAVE|nr:hypothetical protein AVEN_169763-1 [Araneus ventricosus]